LLQYRREDFGNPKDCWQVHQLQPNEVVFTSGTTGSINLIAFGYGVKFLKKDDEILLTQAEHASNVLPWFKVAEMTGAKIKYIPLDKDGRLTVENLRKDHHQKDENRSCGAYYQRFGLHRSD
jgi:selenocysteine lyase/cysteine desulfurase